MSERVVCEECRREGERSVVHAPMGGVSTLMGIHAFYDEDGNRHVHDPNWTTQHVQCSRGHSWGVTRGRPCPADGCSFGRDS